MHSDFRLLILTVLLPAKDHRVYLAAQRILVRIMGSQAPDAIGIIQQNLSGRDATGLADEYLDAVGWPIERSRAVALRRRGPARTIKHSRPVAARTQFAALRQRGPLDPTRN